MTDCNQDDSHREDLAPNRLGEAIRAELSRMSLAERAAVWRMWDGRFLVSALGRSSEHSPSYLEALALASGDLAFEEDGFARVSKDFAEALANFSRQSSQGFQLAKRICVANLASGRLQPELQPLAALILAGEWKAPRPGKGQTSKNWHRDLLFVRGITSAATLEIPATRNEASNSVSGCDLVIEAFKKAGMRETPTYEAVRKIWQRRKELIADEREIEFLIYSQSAVHDWFSAAFDS